MELRTPKVQNFLRLCSILLLILAACLVGFDSQTKSIVYLEKKVTYKVLQAFPTLVYVDAVAAAYNLLQLISRISFLSEYKGSFKSSYRYVYWCCYLVDQVAVYITFGASSAALEQSVLVLTGADAFYWMKWCNKFTRFCFQIGGALFCNYAACALMAFISSISAFNLFRLYSPKHFLVLKTT